MSKYENEKREPDIGDIAKTLRKIDQVLTDKFLEGFYLWWEEDGEKQIIKWKSQDYEEEKIEEPIEDPPKPQGSTEQNGKKFINEKDAAIYIGMSTAFLRQARCHGQIGNRTPGPPYYKIGRAVRYSVEDLNAWLEKNKFGSL